MNGRCEHHSLNGRCEHQCIVYKAEVTTCTTYKEYYGTSEGEYNHTQSFRHISHINGTELSKHIFNVKSKWDWLLSKMEYKIACISILMWHKKVWFVHDQKSGYSSSKPKSSIEQKNWIDIIILSPQEQFYFELSNKRRLNWHSNCLMVYVWYVDCYVIL